MEVCGDGAGYLVGRNIDTGQQVEFGIDVNTDLFIGRDYKRCNLISLDVPTISNRHLKIYSIGYDEDSSSGIPPLVYAQDLSANGTLLKRPKDDADPGKSHISQLLRRGGKPVLLSNEDELFVSPSISFTFVARDPTRVRIKAACKIQQVEKKAFEHLYTISRRKLGTGGFGDVYLAFDRVSGDQLACKVINLRHDQFGNIKIPPINLRSYSSPPAALLSSRETARNGLDKLPSGELGGHIHHQVETSRRLDDILREVNVLKSLSHPNIVGLEKVYWSESTIYIFQELVTAGDLFSYFEFNGGQLSDISTAVIIRQILKAIKYLHGMNIVHRDLKPQNILMTSLSEGARVVVTDFGHARYLQDVRTKCEGQKQSRMVSVVGTYEWSAPEIYGTNHELKEEGYSKAVDMWSIGTITAAMLTGYSFFSHPDDPEDEHSRGLAMVERAGQCSLTGLDTREEWHTVGKRPKDFIKQLLVLNEKARLTVTGALQHPWFTNSHHVLEFDALYARAIKGWHPRGHPQNLIQSLSNADPTPCDRIKTNCGNNFPQHSRPAKTTCQTLPSPYFPPPHDLLAASRISHSPKKKFRVPCPEILNDPPGSRVGSCAQRSPAFSDSFNSFQIMETPPRLGNENQTPPSQGDTPDEISQTLTPLSPVRFACLRPSPVISNDFAVKRSQVQNSLLEVSAPEVSNHIFASPGMDLFDESIPPHQSSFLPDIVDANASTIRQADQQDDDVSVRSPLRGTDHLGSRKRRRLSTYDSRGQKYYDIASQNMGLKLISAKALHQRALDAGREPLI